LIQADIKKLKEAGLHTVQRVTMTTRKDLSAIKGMSDAKIDKLIEAAMKLCENTFLTGAQALEKRKSVIKITTGSKALDDLVGGGIETMSLTEVFGEFRTGKSQLSHTLCVSCQLDVNEGGAAGKAIYIDTEGCFRPEKIMEIAERFGLDSDDVLNNILHARVHNHEQQMNIIPLVAAKMSEDTYRVLVIDSITALFRADFSGRGELAERQQKLQKHLSMLTKLADEFNVAVFITNQVISDPGGGSVFVQDPKKPAGGHVLAHASTTRLYLRKGRAEQRIAKVYDSPLVAENECVFQLSGQGIIDAKD
jgi:meiotic recombination protein DMC1